MLGFRSRDTWLQDFEDAKRSADEAMELIQERTQVVEMGSADTARLTGTIRRFRHYWVVGSEALIVIYGAAGSLAG
eukprot:1191138-Prorocentrum_minimum.AAC.1